MIKFYSNYIQSELPWISNIPSHWRLTKLKFVLDEIFGGGTPDTSNLDDWDDENGIPWVAISDITRQSYITDTAKKISEAGRLSKGLQIIPKETLLVSIFASLGKSALLGIDATVNQAILGLVPSKSLIREYLAYFLSDIERYIGYYSSANTQENLNLTKIKNLTLALPPLLEQQAIANFLDRKTALIDGLIEKKQRQIELLREQCMSLINQAVTKGLNPDVPMKDTGIEWLGEIPKHWYLRRLGHITNLIMDIDHKMPMAVEDGVPFLSAKDLLNDGTLNFENGVKKISEEDFRQLSRKVQPQRNDIIYSRIGARLGKARLVKTDQRFLVSYSCCVVRVDDEIALPEYICFVLDSEIVLTEAKARTVGIGVPDLGLGEIAKFPIPLPSRSEQENILKFLKHKDSQIKMGIKNVSDQIVLLNEFRTSLISAAVTGKVNVRTEG